MGTLSPSSFYNLAMTSNDYTDTDGNRFITSASSVYRSENPAYKAFDGIYQTQSEWHPTYGTPQWLMLQVESPVKIKSFTIWSRPANIEHPTVFTFQGSNDGLNWTDLGSFTWNDSGMGLHKNFTCEVYDSYYTYFRWYFTGVTSSPYAVVNEILFTDVEVSKSISIKYLIYDVTSSKYYNVVNSTLNELMIDILSATDFITHGNDTPPAIDVLATLNNFKILCWSSDETHTKKFKATIKGTPAPQTITTDDIDISDKSITGIEKITAEYTGSPLVACSFDNGVVWKMYNGKAWVVLSEGVTGMTMETLLNITSENWNIILDGINSFKMRFTLTTVEDTVTNIYIDYTN